MRQFLLNVCLVMACGLLLCGCQNTARKNSVIGATHAEYQGLRAVFNSAHARAIDCLRWSPDGKFIATTANDFTVRIWDPGSGRLVRILKGQQGWFDCIEWSPDSRYIVSGNDDQIARVWELSIGRLVSMFTRHKKGVCSVKWSPNGRMIVSSDSETAYVWEALSGRESAIIQGFVLDGSWSPDSSLFAAAVEGKGITILRPETGRPQTAIRVRDQDGVFVRWSPDCRYIAAGGSDGAGVWEASTGKQIRRLGKCQDAKWVSNGLHLALESEKGVRIIHALNGSEIGAGPPGYCSPDGRCVCTLDQDKNQLLIIELATKQVIRRAQTTSIGGFTIEWSPDGSHIAFPMGSGIGILDVRSGQLVRSPDSTGYISSLAWSPDDRLMAVGSMVVKESDCNLSVQIRRTTDYTVTGRLPTEWGSIDSLDWDPSGRFIAGSVMASVRVWQLRTLRPIRVFENPFGGHKVTWSKNGSLLAWDTAYKEPVGVSIWRTTEASPRNRIIPRAGLPAWSPDGRKIAVEIGYGPERAEYVRPLVAVWDAGSLTCLGTLRGCCEFNCAINALAWSPDGKLIAAAGNDAGIRLWEVQEGSLARVLPGHRNGFPVTSLCWSPDSKFIASASADGTVRIWDIRREKLAATLRGQSGGVRTVSWSHNGKWIASGNDDSTICIWDAESWKLTATVVQAEDATLVTTPEGFFSGTGDFHKYVHFVRGTEIFDFNQFYDVFYRPDLVERKLKGENVSKYSAGLSIAEAMKSPPPEVTILSPKEATASAGRTATVRIRVKDTGGRIGDVRLYHNGKLADSLGVYRVAKGEEEGKPMRVARADVGRLYAMATRGATVRRVCLDDQTGSRTVSFRPAKGTVERTYSVQLVHGENTISAAAFNGTNTVMSAMETVNVRCAAPARQPKLYVLVVGANRYADPHYNLGLAVKDASDFRSLVEKAARGLYASVETRLLTDHAATKLGIIRAALDMGRAMKPEDVLVIYAAMHGTTADDRYYLLTTDFDGYVRESNTLSSVELVELSKRLPALKQVLSLDTCEAGGMNSIVAGLYDSRVSVLAKALGMHLFAGAKSYQTALDDYHGNGLFTHFLLEGLRGSADRNRDRTITAVEMSPYLTRSVKQASGGKQVPFIRNFGEDIRLSVAR